MIAPSSDEIEALNNADQDSDARKHRFRIGVVPVYGEAAWQESQKVKQTLDRTHTSKSK